MVFRRQPDKGQKEGPTTFESQLFWFNWFMRRAFDERNTKKDEMV